MFFSAFPAGIHAKAVINAGVLRLDRGTKVFSLHGLSFDVIQALSGFHPSLGFATPWSLPLQVKTFGSMDNTMDNTTRKLYRK
jgi:hypothetical protein